MAVLHTVAGTVVKERHPLAPLGLSIITLGVYGIVWYYKINKELHAATGQGSPGVSLLAITLGAFLIVPPFVSWFNTAERIRLVQDRVGVSGPVSPGLALVIAVVPLVSFFAMTYLQSHLNSAWQRLSRPSAALPGAPDGVAAGSPMREGGPSRVEAPPAS